MARAGADVFRVNGAHADVEDIHTWARRVRKASRQAECPAGLMIDLPGIKMRTGRFQGQEGVTLKAGSRVELFGGRSGGSETRIPVTPWPKGGPPGKGTTVLLDDGRLRLAVLSRSGDSLRAEVEEGGLLLAGKGVAFPGAKLALDVPTRRDRLLAKAAVEVGADWLSQSFVASAADVKRLKKLTARAGAPDMPIVAKIERHEAFDDLDGILRAADAAIVARGDLGVDVGAENVPALQKRIIESARRTGRPVIVATEMLDSMTTRVRPTRAEVSDVAGAVFEGTDAVMLSGETAVGVHPVLAVQTMERVLKSTESDPHALYAGSGRLPPPLSSPDRPDQHVVHAAVMLAVETKARAIVVFSRTGASAVRLSKERPRAQIHAFTGREAVCRRLSLAWGVHPLPVPAGGSTDAVMKHVLDRLRTSKALQPGDRAVLVMGSRQDPAGATTLIKLLTL